MRFSCEWGNSLTRLQSTIRIHILFASAAMAGAGTNNLGLGHYRSSIEKKEMMQSSERLLEDTC
jgi:hypothetical protein